LQPLGGPQKSVLTPYVKIARFAVCQIVISFLLWTRRNVAGARPTAHVDAGAIAAGHFGIDEGHRHDPAIEGGDLTVLRTRGLATGADIVLAAGATLEAQLLQFGLVGEIHHHTTSRSLADDERVVASVTCIGLGPLAVLSPVIGGITPASDHLRDPNRCGDFR